MAVLVPSSINFNGRTSARDDYVGIAWRTGKDVLRSNANKPAFTPRADFIKDQKRSVWTVGHRQRVDWVAGPKCQRYAAEKQKSEAHRIRITQNGMTAKGSFVERLLLGSLP